MTRILAALSLALALAACGDKAERPADDRRSAEGEVLGGTISDAMLPLDTVTSQSPPLRETPSPGAITSAEPAAADGDSIETPPAEPTPEPTPEDGAD